MTMRIKRIAVAAGVAAVGIAGFAAAANAASVIVTPSSGIDGTPGANPSVNVSWTGLLPGQYGFVEECRKTDTDPTFNYLNDCSSYNEVQFKSDNSGNYAGSAFALFTGDEPGNGDWGCGNAGLTASGGPVYTTCYIRIAPGTPTNSASDFFTPISFSPPANTPEVPLNVLLPLGGAAVLGGAYMITRKRQMANVA